jgi:hypothetical protein
MPDPTSEPGADDEQSAASASGTPGFAAGGAARPENLDWQVLLDALAAGGLLEGSPDDQDAVAAAERDAVADGRMSGPLPAGQAGALAVEHMDPGPAQAGWLAVAAAEAASLDEYQLAGVAIAARRLASWATAAELGAVAQITARAAAADCRIGLRAGGRPARLCRDAVGQVSLALMLTDHSATAWAGALGGQRLAYWSPPRTHSSAADPTSMKKHGDGRYGEPSIHDQPGEMWPRAARMYRCRGSALLSVRAIAA